MGKGVNQNQTGYTGSTGGGEKGSYKWSPFTIPAGNRKHQKYGPDKDEQQKTQSNHLRTGHTFFKFPKHNKIPIPDLNNFR